MMGTAYDLWVASQRRAIGPSELREYARLEFSGDEIRWMTDPAPSRERRPWRGRLRELVRRIRSPSPIPGPVEGTPAPGPR